MVINSKNAFECEKKNQMTNSVSLKNFRFTISNSVSDYCFFKKNNLYAASQYQLQFYKYDLVT